MSTSNQPINVILLPGIVTPVSISYQALLEFLKDNIKPVLKDLEVYADDKPPSNYNLNFEIDSLKRVADQAGFEKFHLVGFSGGGAVSLAFTALYPDRLQTLALIEPAWIGNETSAEDIFDWAELDRVTKLPVNEQMDGFARWHMRPGFDPPKQQLPPGPPPAWMAKRPAGISALVGAFKAYDLNQEQFRSFRKPVYYALGNLTRAIFERRAKTLSRLFPDFKLEVYEGRSHFDPPHRAEPERFAGALQKLWSS